MGQLSKENNAWSTGYSSFFTNDLLAYPVAVKCRLGNLKESDTALLDTGAEWSVIGGETVKILEDQLGLPIESLSMSTRFGRIDGALHRMVISLPAYSGDGLTVESTVFISEEWEGPIVLGYRGFLERIRFALDPGIVADEQFFYFGL